MPCATTNLYREATDFLELWQECPRLRSAIRFGNESCDNSYTIIEANVTITRVNFSHRKVTRKELVEELRRRGYTVTATISL